MKKKKNVTKALSLSKWLLFLFVSVGLTMTGCKSYDDEIDDINKKIENLKGDLSGLKERVTTLEGAGTTPSKYTITNVETVTDGIKLTFGDGSTYTVSTNTAKAPAYDIKLENNILYVNGEKKGEVKVDGNGNPVTPAPTGVISIKNLGNNQGEILVDGKSTTPKAFVSLEAKTLVASKKADKYEFYYVVNGVVDETTRFSIPFGSRVLTNAVFVPEDFVWGVEAIVLPSSAYQAVTNTNGLWVETATEISIAKTATASYRMNSSYIGFEDIKTPTYTVKSANHHYLKSATADEGEDAIIVSPLKAENFKNNILTLNIKMNPAYKGWLGTNGSVQINNDQSKMNIASLKIPLADKHIVADKEEFVYVDYVRVLLQKYRNFAISNNRNVQDGYVSTIPVTTADERFKFYNDSISVYMGNNKDVNGGVLASQWEYKAFRTDRFTSTVSQDGPFWGGISQNGRPLSDARVEVGGSVDLKNLYTTVTAFNENGKKLVTTGSSNVPGTRGLGNVDYFKSIKDTLAILKPADLAAYGFELRYYMAKGANMWGSNNTDQQQFAKVSVDGILETQVYNESDYGAAVGRTPIVRVELVDVVNKKLVDFKYIRVEITPKEAPSQAITYDFGTEYVGCQLDHQIFDTELMNTKIYNVAKMSKEQFHKTYPTFVQTTSDFKTTIAANPAERKSTLVQIKDVLTGESTSTFVLDWDIWKHLTDAQQKSLIESATPYDLTVYGKYIGTNGSEFRVTFKVKVARPAQSVGINTNYWKNNVGQLNVNTPKDINYLPSECVFTPNLHQLFALDKTGLADVQYSPKNDPDARDKMKAIVTSCLKREFRFTGDYATATTKPVAATKVNGEDAFIRRVASTVPGDVFQYELYHSKSGELIATIYEDGTIELKETPTGTDSQVKRFLNTGELKITNLKLITKNWAGALNASNNRINPNVNLIDDHVNFEALVKTFDVTFIRPLFINPVANKNFQDAQDFGSDLLFTDIFNLYDWRATGQTVQAEKEKYRVKMTFAAYTGLAKFYDVFAMSADIFDIKTKISATQYLLDNSKIYTNLKKSGADWVVDNTITKPGVGLLLPDYTQLTAVQKSVTTGGTTYANGWVLNYNTNMSVVQEQYKIWIPIKIGYKWGQVEDYIVVTVDPVVKK